MSGEEYRVSEVNDGKRVMLERVGEDGEDFESESTWLGYAEEGPLFKVKTENWRRKKRLRDMKLGYEKAERDLRI